MTKKPVIVKKEVKLAYVEQILLKKLSVPEVAKELNVRNATVYEWVKKYREEPKDFMPGSGKQKPEDAEISKILRENKQLKAEVDFLKKQRCTLQQTTNKVHIN